MTKQEVKNLVNPLLQYKFWFKVFAAVLLIVFGILALVNPNNSATAIVLLFVGGVFVLYSLFRIVPVIKSVKNKYAIILNVCEIVLMALIGGCIIWSGIESFGTANVTKFAGFCYKHFNILVATVFWVRGVVYFVSTVLFHEDTTKLQFFVHLFAISFGAFLFGVKIDIEKVLLAIAILAFVSAAAIGTEGGFEYGRYRKSVKKVEIVEEEVKDEEELELPSEENTTIEEEPEVIVPITEPEQNQDTLIN